MLNTLLIFSVFILAALSFILGIFSFIKNPQSKVVRLWVLAVMATAVWSTSFLLMLLSNTEQAGTFYSKFLHVGAAFIPIFFYHFVVTFLYKEKENRIFLVFGYILGVIFAILSLTKLIIAGASLKFGFYWVDAGSLYPLLLIYFWFYALASIYLLYRGYLQSDGITKRKVFYVLLAAIIGFASGGTSYLPQTLGIYAFGDFFTWLYPILITYGIFFDQIKIRM